MANLGQVNELMVLKTSDYGLYLKTDTLGDVLLPNAYVTEEIEPGDMIKVFLHRDSDDRLVATTETPKAMVGDFAVLTVKDVGGVGAFMDWGLGKDLLVPFSEQKGRLQVGQKALVRVYLDPKSERIVASMRLNRFLDTFEKNYMEGESVKLIVASKTDLGFNVIVNGVHWGLIFHDDVDRPLPQGHKVDGYIKTVREDGKINISLRATGYERIGSATEQVLDAIRKAGGTLALHDKSSPDDIRDMLNMSKKTFKQAVGSLYRERKIVLESHSIRLA